MVDVRRRGSKRFPNDSGNLLQRLPEFRVLRSIFLRERRDFLRRLLRILIKRKRSPIGRQRGYAQFRRDPVQAVLLQLHIAYDVGTDRSGRVRQRGTAKTRMELICNRGPANLRTTFERQRLVPCLSQVECGDQPVVATADDDHVALVISRLPRHG